MMNTCSSPQLLDLPPLGTHLVIDRHSVQATNWTSGAKWFNPTTERVSQMARVLLVHGDRVHIERLTIHA